MYKEISVSIAIACALAGCNARSSSPPPDSAQMMNSIVASFQNDVQSWQEAAVWERGLKDEVRQLPTADREQLRRRIWEIAVQRFPEARNAFASLSSQPSGERGTVAPMDDFTAAEGTSADGAWNCFWRPCLYDSTCQNAGCSECVLINCQY